MRAARRSVRHTVRQRGRAAHSEVARPLADRGQHCAVVLRPPPPTPPRRERKGWRHRRRASDWVRSGRAISIGRRETRPWAALLPREEGGRGNACARVENKSPFAAAAFGVWLSPLRAHTVTGAEETRGLHATGAALPHWLAQACTALLRGQCAAHRPFQGCLCPGGVSPSTLVTLIRFTRARTATRQRRRLLMGVCALNTKCGEYQCALSQGHSCPQKESYIWRHTVLFAAASFPC